MARCLLGDLGDLSSFFAQETGAIVFPLSA